MIKVKICGITNSDDASLCVDEGADALGLIFSARSPRCVSEKEAKHILAGLGPFVAKVGVFIDEDKEKAFSLASSLGLDVVQFHGKESPAYCSAFIPHFKVIKVLFPRDRPFAEKVSTYKVDAFIFDIEYEEKTKGKKRLSKESLREVRALIAKGVRVIISGGLNPDNVSAIVSLDPYAVDVSSGVEQFVRKKDKELVRNFIRSVKNEVS